MREFSNKKYLDSGCGEAFMKIHQVATMAAGRTALMTIANLIECQHGGNADSRAFKRVKTEHAARRWSAPAPQAQ